MRIITGYFKGLKLCTFPKDSYIRPMTDRVKTCLFDTLIPYIEEHTKVLDLFSGTGSLGLEALSRGVGYVQSVDNNKESIQIIKKNISLIYQSHKALLPRSDAFGLASVKSRKTYVANNRQESSLKSHLPRIGDNVCLTRQDVFSFLKSYGNFGFDLILADPPFREMYGQRILDHLSASKAVKQDTILAIELSSREEIPSDSHPSYICFKEKRFGDKKMLFYRFKV